MVKQISMPLVGLTPSSDPFQDGFYDMLNLRFQRIPLKEGQGHQQLWW